MSVPKVMTPKTPYFGPQDALWEAVLAGYVSSQGRKPGIIVERLPAHVREQLKLLTSDEARKTRVDGRVR